MNYFGLLALFAGMAISMQASMNAQLGVLLKNSLMSTVIAFSVSGLCSLLALLVMTKNYSHIFEIKTVPIYLWFSGGTLSAMGVGIFYYLIPKIGIDSVMTYALIGQIILAITASHFGWFDLPIKALNIKRILGLLILIMGVLLVDRD